jgi:hypothetical protein
MYTKDICRDKPPKVSSKANVMRREILQNQKEKREKR